MMLGTYVAADESLNAYEQQRADRIARNQKVLEDMGILRQASLFETGLRASKNTGLTTTRRASKKDRSRPDTPIQRRLSARIAEVPPANKGLTGDEVEKHGRLVLDEAVVDPEHEKRWMEYCNRHRCDSQSRGSVYDSKAGICCHFCRQKKLCGEEGCERCIQRNPDLPCIGKSECSRCHSAQGRFCRACLLVRYGMKLGDVKAAADTWLCPHCYEEDHPEKGWICNSSICMTRRGMKPTGIAIFEAQQKGFPSVAHFVQAQILGRAGRNPPHAPKTSAHQAQRAVAEAQPAYAAPAAAPAAETAAGKKEDSEQSPRAAKLPKKGSQGRVLVAVDVTQAGKTSPGESAQAPGTPKLSTPVKRPVSADLPMSEGRALRRQSLQDRMQTMTPGASKATSGACTAEPRMTRAARRKLAVVG